MIYTKNLAKIEHALGNRYSRQAFRYVLLRNDGLIATDSFVMAYMQSGKQVPSEDRAVDLNATNVAVDGEALVALLKEADKTFPEVTVSAIGDEDVTFDYFSSVTNRMEIRKVHRLQEEYPNVFQLFDKVRVYSIDKNSIPYIGLDLKLLTRMGKIMSAYHKNQNAVIMFGETPAEPVYIRDAYRKQYEILVMPVRIDDKHFTNIYEGL